MVKKSGVRKPMAVYVAGCAPIRMFLPLDLLPIYTWPVHLSARLVLWLYLLKWQLKCWATGEHDIVKAPWIRKEDGEVIEYHCGCTRCTLFWTETSDERRTSEPRVLYWESRFDEG